MEATKEELETLLSLQTFLTWMLAALLCYHWPLHSYLDLSSLTFSVSMWHRCAVRSSRWAAPTSSERSQTPTDRASVNVSSSSPRMSSSWSGTSLGSGSSSGMAWARPVFLSRFQCHSSRCQTQHLDSRFWSLASPCHAWPLARSTDTRFL